MSHHIVEYQLSKLTGHWDIQEIPVPMGSIYFGAQVVDGIVCLTFVTRDVPASCNIRKYISIVSNQRLPKELVLDMYETKTGNHKPTDRYVGSFQMQNDWGKYMIHVFNITGMNIKNLAKEQENENG